MTVADDPSRQGISASRHVRALCYPVAAMQPYLVLISLLFIAPVSERQETLGDRWRSREDSNL